MNDDLMENQGEYIPVKNQGNYFHGELRKVFRWKIRVPIFTSVGVGDLYHIRFLSIHLYTQKIPHNIQYKQSECHNYIPTGQEAQRSW
jgi:hypothetical protein